MKTSSRPCQLSTGLTPCGIDIRRIDMRQSGIGQHREDMGAVKGSEIDGLMQHETGNGLSWMQGRRTPPPRDAGSGSPRQRGPHGSPDHPGSVPEHHRRARSYGAPARCWQSQAAGDFNGFDDMRGLGFLGQAARKACVKRSIRACAPCDG